MVAFGVALGVDWLKDVHTAALIHISAPSNLVQPLPTFDSSHLFTSFTIPRDLEVTLGLLHGTARGTEILGSTLWLRFGFHSPSHRNWFEDNLKLQGTVVDILTVHNAKTYIYVIQNKNILSGRKRSFTLSGHSQFVASALHEIPFSSSESSRKSLLPMTIRGNRKKITTPQHSKPLQWLTTSTFVFEPLTIYARCTQISVCHCMLYMYTYKCMSIFASIVCMT